MTLKVEQNCTTVEKIKIMAEDRLKWKARQPAVTKES